MKRAFLTASLALALLSGCSSQGINKHWETESTLPRMGRFFLGYNGEKDGSYLDFSWRRKRDNYKTLTRHFLNLNPDNPNHNVSGGSKERPLHSILPNPFYFFDPITLFIPIDGVIGLFYEDGLQEFGRGVAMLGEPVATITTTFAHEIVAPPLAGTVTGLAKILPKRETQPAEGEEAPAEEGSAE